MVQYLLSKVCKFIFDLCGAIMCFYRSITELKALSYRVLTERVNKPMNSGWRLNNKVSQASEEPE